MRRTDATTRQRQRGMAMTELLFCTFPYCLLILGAVFLWHMASGKQEISKFITSSAATGQKVEIDDFFKGLKGTPQALAETTYTPEQETEYNTLTEVDSDFDEPVLPYDTAGDDVWAGMCAVLYQGAYSKQNDTIVLNMTSMGKFLCASGYLEEASTPDSIALELGGPQQVDPVKSADGDVAMREISEVMSRWLSYHRSQARYTYALESGHGELPFEDRSAYDTSKVDWRSERGVTIPADEDAKMKQYSAFAATAENPARYGTHCAGPAGVLLNELPRDFGGVDPDSLDLPPDLGAAYWDKAQ